MTFIKTILGEKSGNMKSLRSRFYEADLDGRFDGSMTSQPPQTRPSVVMNPTSPIDMSGMITYYCFALLKYYFRCFSCRKGDL